MAGINQLTSTQGMGFSAPAGSQSPTMSNFSRISGYSTPNVQQQGGFFDSPFMKALTNVSPILMNQYASMMGMGTTDYDKVNPSGVGIDPATGRPALQTNAFGQQVQNLQGIMPDAYNPNLLNVGAGVVKGASGGIVGGIVGGVTSLIGEASKQNKIAKQRRELGKDIRDIEGGWQPVNPDEGGRKGLFGGARKIRAGSADRVFVEGSKHRAIDSFNAQVQSFDAQNLANRQMQAIQKRRSMNAMNMFGIPQQQGYSFI